MWHHPKYYKELRKRNKSDQAISLRESETSAGERAPGQGLKQQAASDSQVVNQVKLSSQSQASSTKLQAPSDSNSRPQASSPKQQASSSKPQATSSKIWEPRKSFTVPEPRCSMQIKVLCGCFLWKAIWCGEKRTLLPFVTLSSTVKKVPELL